MTRVVALILCLGLMGGSTPARAVDDAMAPSDIDARIAELEARQRRIELRGPAIGTLGGSALLGAGLGFGLATVISCGGGDGACSPEHIAGFGVSAGVLTILGIATLVPSSRKLREGKRERQAIEEEIRRLEASRAFAPRPRIRIGLVPGQTTRVTVGWIY